MKIRDKKDLKKTTKYTIQETTKLTGLPESTLRYYESMGLIPPIKRDESSKHRIYSEKDLDIIVSVACLSATGMSISDMCSYLESAGKNGGSAEIQIKLLQNQAKHLIDEAASVKLRQQYVAAKIDYWQAIEKGDPKEIEKVKKQTIEIAMKLKDLKIKENKK